MYNGVLLRTTDLAFAFFSIDRINVHPHVHRLWHTRGILHCQASVSMFHCPCRQLNSAVYMITPDRLGSEVARIYIRHAEK
jgi:hypothetical protein